MWHRHWNLLTSFESTNVKLLRFEILTFTWPGNSPDLSLPNSHLTLSGRFVPPPVTVLHLVFTLPSSGHHLTFPWQLEMRENLELDKSLWARIIFGFIWSFAACWLAHPLSSCILLNKSFESFPPCLLVIEVWWLPELTINTDQAHSFSVFEAFNIKLQQITPFLGRRTRTQILGKCIWSRVSVIFLLTVLCWSMLQGGRGPANVISKVVFGVYLQLCGVRLPVSVLRVVGLLYELLSPQCFPPFVNIKLCHRTRHQAPGHDNTLMFLRLLNSQVRTWNQGGYCQINLLIYPRSLVTT